MQTMNYTDLRSFMIYSNEYLSKITKAYYTFDYYGGVRSENTNFILTLKNNFANYYSNKLIEAENKAVYILSNAIKEITEKECMSNVIIISVPRSKAYDTYCASQLHLINAISLAAQSNSFAEDGAYYIVRKINTKTNHLGRAVGRKKNQNGIVIDENVNDGRDPYPGITNDTCDIAVDKIHGKEILLVDDIYTKTCNVDEDCIQALYNAGASKVVFYAFAKTARSNL